MDDVDAGLSGLRRDPEILKFLLSEKHDIVTLGLLYLGLRQRRTRASRGKDRDHFAVGKLATHVLKPSDELPQLAARVERPDRALDREHDGRSWRVSKVIDRISPSRVPREGMHVEADEEEQ